MAYPIPWLWQGAGPRTVAIGDFYFEGCTVGLKGSGIVNRGDYYLWAKDTELIFEAEGGISDGSLEYWADNCQGLVRIDGGSYAKTFSTMQGFDASKRTLTKRGVRLNGRYTDASLFDSWKITVDPDNVFFLIGNTVLSLADYKNGGSEVQYTGGRRVVGWA